MRATGGGTGRSSAGAGRVGTALAVILLGVAAILLVLRPLSIVLPAAGLDFSWITVLGEAATRPARWGVDLAFTYGPASALVTRYFTEGYLVWALPACAGIALVNGFALVLLARGAAAARRSAGLLAVAVVAAEVAGLAAELALDQDSFYFALALVLLLLDLARRPGERVAAATVLAGAALLGASAAAKTSYGVVAVGAFAIADARALLARRRPPLLTLAALAAALAAFLAFGQRFGDLPAYLDLQGQEASGYGEAMYLVPGRLELGLFLLAAAVLTVVAGLCGPPGRGGRAAAALGTAFVLAVGVKAGFVRADTHTQIAWSLLGLAGIAVAAALVLRRSVTGAALLGACSLAVLWAVGPLFLLDATGQPTGLARLPDVYRDMGDDFAAEAGAWGRFLPDPSRFVAAARAAKAQAWAAVRAAQPLPKLDGPVDILPSEQSAVLANGLDYRPRPSFQDYSTYTAGLIAADAGFVGGDRAPDWVIVGGGSLDDRYPTSTEGALWPELLRSYEPQRRAGPWVALRRRPTPLGDVLGPPLRVDARLGERFAVSATGPVFAQVTVRKTLLGRLATLVFRPPALGLRVMLAGGSEQSYRFIPAIAAGGFLLSPILTDADGFADLAFGLGRDTGAAEVTAATVGGGRWAGLFYDPSVSVEIRPVTVPASPPSLEAQALHDDLARALPWRRLARSLGRGGQLDGDRLSVPAPTTLTVPVAGARRLSLGFGIADGAWTEGATQGVCFAVEASAGSAPLWRRCLDPRAVAADRGPQSAEIDLPPGLAAVTASTTCLKDCSWGWSYWNGIAAERVKL